MADSRPAPGLAPTAARNAIATVGVRLSGLAVGMILTPFVLGRIGPELYGVLVVTASAYEYLSLLRGGVGGALRRFVTVHHHAGQHEQARHYYAAGFWWAALLRVAILLVGVALAAPLGGFLRVPDSLLADCVAGVALLFTAAVISDTAALLEIPIYATGRTAGLSATWGLLTWLRLGLTMLAFRLMAPGLAVYGGAAIATEIVSVLVLAILAQRSRVVGPAIPRPQLGAHGVRRELFRYGGLSLLTQAATLLYLSTDHLLIGRCFGVGAVTHYSMGARWFPLILGFIVVSITSLTPLFTSMDARGELERSRDALRRVIGVASVLAVPACLAPCVVGDLFLMAWVGAEYRDSARYMIAMLVPLTFEAAVAPVWMALNARGRIGSVAAVTVPVAFGNVGLSLWLALGLGMGPLGFALGNTAALLAKNAVLLALLARRPDPGIPPVRQVLRPLVLAVLGGLPGLALLYLARGALAGGLARVIAGAALGGIVCLAGAALATFGPRGIRDLAGTAVLAVGSGRRAVGAIVGEPTPPSQRDPAAGG